MRAQSDLGATNDPSSIRIFIIEDHAIVRAGLRMLLENNPRMQVVLEAPNVTEALSSCAGQQPDIIILDLDLGQENGLEFISGLLERFNGVRVLVLTATNDTQIHLRAVAAGASGVVIKEQAPEMLLKAIQSIHAGEAWLGHALMSAVLGQFSRARTPGSKSDPSTAKIARLTPREREVVELITEGLHSDRIASQLRISEGTVRNHLTSILAKLELSNRFELAVFAFRHGLHRPACD